MSMVAQFKHEFVKSAPRELSPGILYLSMEYCTMLHLCACGCGRKVVTPLSPSDWNMTFNGETITVRPSIGSWSLPCKSHYVIKRSKVHWAGQWNDEQIKNGRKANLERKGRRVIPQFAEPTSISNVEEPTNLARSFWGYIINWLGR